jgi:hypothetical protein
MYDKELIMPGPTGNEFHVTGDEGVLMDLYAEAERQARGERFAEIGKQALIAPVAVLGRVGRYVGQVMHNYGQELELTVFDAVHGTDLKAERERQAREERILQMAQKHNLIKTTYCAKHEAVLKEVRGL